MIAPVTQAGMGVWLQNVCKILEKNHEITLLTSNLPGVKISSNNFLYSINASLLNSSNNSKSL